MEITSVIIKSKFCLYLNVASPAWKPQAVKALGFVLGFVVFIRLKRMAYQRKRSKDLKSLKI